MYNINILANSMISFKDFLKINITLLLLIDVVVQKCCLRSWCICFSQETPLSKQKLHCQNRTEHWANNCCISAYCHQIHTKGHAPLAKKIKGKSGGNVCVRVVGSNGRCSGGGRVGVCRERNGTHGDDTDEATFMKLLNTLFNTGVLLTQEELHTEEEEEAGKKLQTKQFFRCFCPVQSLS